MAFTNIADLMHDSGVTFGTSGARGLVEKMTDRVCYAYTLGFLQHIQNSYGVQAGTAIALAGDLRPSTERIMIAVAKAITDSGYRVVNCGRIPSPAVALFGIQNNSSSLMVTGSHIPDDRNGIKFNSPVGEITKDDETGITTQRVNVPETLFLPEGTFTHHERLPAEESSARDSYIKRFINFFGESSLEGLRIGVYQHSGVAREIIVEVLKLLGATPVPLGYSDAFVPVDTEAIRPEDIELAKNWATQGKFDAIVSTDGDGDRPLVSDNAGNWLRGDMVGCLCSHFLEAEHVVTPVSSNTNVDKSGWFQSVTRTRIGSPFVIAGMKERHDQGLNKVVGYEANGGFLQYSPLTKNGIELTALPTRDALIVILALLRACRVEKISISELARSLPERYTCSNRIKQIPTANSLAKLAEFDCGNAQQDKLLIIEFLHLPMNSIATLDRTDGLRITLSNEDIIHLRPSGNAPELRCYTESTSVSRAEEMNRETLAIVEQSLSG
jgi:phosphomannomutase